MILLLIQKGTLLQVGINCEIRGYSYSKGTFSCPDIRIKKVCFDIV